MLMDNYLFATLYDILGELVSAVSEKNEKGNSVIVLSSDTKNCCICIKDSTRESKEQLTPFHLFVF